MLSLFVALCVVISSLFSTNVVEPVEYANDIPANFDTTNPIDITNYHVDDLSYGEFDIAVEECYAMHGENEIAGNECVYALAIEYPDFGKAYYSDLTLRMNYVDSYANDFFTYYDTVYSGLKA